MNKPSNCILVKIKKKRAIAYKHYNKALNFYTTGFWYAPSYVCNYSSEMVYQP